MGVWVYLFGGPPFNLSQEESSEIKAGSQRRGKDGSPMTVAPHLVLKT